jgi:hypothetical protein
MPPKITNTLNGGGGREGQKGKGGGEEEGVKDEPYDTDGFHLKVPLG